MTVPEELKARVLAAVERYGEDVGFGFIAEKVGCTFKEAFEAYLAATIGDVDVREVE